MFETLQGEHRAALFGPALLYDIGGPLLSGELLLRELAADDPERPAVLWRTLQLAARLDPLGTSLRVAAAGPPPPEQADLARRVEVEAALGSGRLDDAERLLDGHPPTGPWLRLAAMAARARGRHRDALALCDQAVEQLGDGAELVEELAATLLVRAGCAGELGEPERARADSQRVVELCTAHDAHISVQVAQLTAAVEGAGLARDEILAVARTEAVDQAKARLTEDLDVDQASLGPIPLHVHAAFSRHYRDRQQMIRDLLDLLGLQHRAGQLGEAYATIHYAARIASRFPDPEVTRVLTEACRAYEELLGPDELARQRAYLDERAETFLATMRRVN